MGLPEQLVDQFRTVAVQRLARVEAAWEQLVGDPAPAVADAIDRELHTLKGESRVVNFTDVNLVCHKTEDLFELARARGYAIDEELDLAVNMALRFMTMLVRKRVGTNLGGFDLPGFLRHIDKLLDDARREQSGRHRSISSSPPFARPGGARIPRATRERFCPAAVDAFIEYAAARGTRRDRLRTSWHTMRDLVGIQRALLGPEPRDKHRVAGLELARDLGKSVDIRIEPGSVEITTEILAACDAAVLHLVRNAIDHGIEPSGARVAAGKSPTGTLRVTRELARGSLVVSVADDGRGIDFARVRARALELGLVSEVAAARYDAEQWIELVCAPGFSTRTETSDVSGRGVGLDAVRSFAREVGGSVEASTIDGAGTTWSLTFPVPVMAVDGYLLRAHGVPFPILLDGAWVPTDAHPALIFDVATALGLAAETTGTAHTFRRDRDTIAVRMRGGAGAGTRAPVDHHRRVAPGGCRRRGYTRGSVDPPRAVHLVT